MSDKKDSVICDLKTPKRVLHFSDGVLEEDDFDEEERDTKNSNESKQIVLVCIELSDVMNQTNGNYLIR